MLGLLAIIALSPPALAQEPAAATPAAESGDTDDEGTLADPPSEETSAGEAPPAAEATPASEDLPPASEDAPSGGDASGGDSTEGDDSSSGDDGSSRPHTEVVRLGGDREPRDPNKPAVNGLATSPYGVGVGVILGLPTGLSGAWRPEGRSTVAMGAAWSFTSTSFHLHADYLFHVYEFRVPDAPAINFAAYVGGGGRVKLGGEDGFDLGLRIPLGLTILPDEVPIDGFFELVPVVGLVPDTDLSLEAAIGARVFFN